ncbi:hypothetical protein FRB95_003856 [Tulasnella sp. JGI-2019a]|nr:hypothetical protein FRB95_003856 [Tulasnella sp. JGI-2019a]
MFPPSPVLYGGDKFYPVVIPHTIPKSNHPPAVVTTVFNVNLTEYVGSGATAEVWQDKAQQTVAKVAFTEEACSALCHEALIYQFHLHGCPAVPTYYGFYEGDGMAFILMQDIGDGVHKDEIEEEQVFPIGSNLIQTLMC